MDYIDEFVYNDLDQLVLEPEDWTIAEWTTILKVFGLKRAQRIVISNYHFQAYGEKKEK